MDHNWPRADTRAGCCARSHADLWEWARIHDAARGAGLGAYCRCRRALGVDSYPSGGAVCLTDRELSMDNYSMRVLKLKRFLCPLNPFRASTFKDFFKKRQL